MHEHVFVVTAEVQQNYPEEWGDQEQRVADAVRRLSELPKNGIRTIVDVTVIGQGRDIRRIKRIADQVPELNIVVATGIYTFDEVPLFFSRQAEGDDDRLLHPRHHRGHRRYRHPGGHAQVRGGRPGTHRGRRARAPRGRPRTQAPACRSRSTRTRPGSTARRSSTCSHPPGSTWAWSSSAIPATGSTIPTTWSEWPRPDSPWAWTDSASTTSPPSQQRCDLVVEMCRRGYADRMVLSHDCSCYLDWFWRPVPWLRLKEPTLPARQPGRSALPARPRGLRRRAGRDAGPHPARILAGRAAGSLTG